MSESPVFTPESQTPREQLGDATETLKPVEAERVSQERSPSDALEQIRERLAAIHEYENTPIGANLESEDTDEPSVLGIQKVLKNDAFRDTMRTVRASLPSGSVLFSKIIHNPSMDRASEITSRTIARPAGLLGGGITALAISAISLILAKRYGFSYNYGTLLISFLAGYTVVTIIEIVSKIIRRNHH